MKKKIFATMLAVSMMAAGLVGCSSSNTAAPAATTAAPAATEAAKTEAS